MSTLRRILPVLAALLAVIVVIQTTDLVACADEAVAAESSETHTGALASGGHPTPAPGDSHDDSDRDHDGTFADCLCHVVFTPTAVVPEVGVRPAAESVDYDLFVVGWTDAAAQGIDPVPLA